MHCRRLSAALLSLVPAVGAAQHGQQPLARESIDAALDKGVGFLLATYEKRIARDQLAEERVGQCALSLYTLLKCGVARDDVVVRGLLAHVMFQPVHHTYDAACALLAASAYDPIGNRRWIAALSRQLLDWQTEDGDWSYPHGGSDLSNTQYAALGLWSAARAGAQIQPRVWERLAEAVLDYRSMGGFSYTSGGGAATGSMTAAGCGVLAICERELRLCDRWHEPLARSIQRAREGGLAWLASHFSVTENPPGGGWPYYYLYGVERLGALAGLTRIGEHDWYEKGAAFLVDAQGSDGTWNNDRNLSDTCFALLFLERATSAGRKRAVTGVAGPAAGSTSALRIAAAGDGPTRVWVDGWDRRLVGDLEWPHERGHGPRVARVEYIEDERVVAVELGDPTRPCEGTRFAIEHVFSGAGKRRIRARAVVLAPGAPSREQVLDSQLLELEVARAWPRWIEEERADTGPDLLRGVEAKVRASSEAGFSSTPLGITFAAELALDGRVQTPWLADGDDERRTLNVVLERPVEGDALRISPAVLVTLGVDFLARPIEIGVEVNGKEAGRLAMDPDPSHAITLDLGRTIAVKRLEVRILSVARSPSSALVGIAEIELFRRAR